MTPPISRRSFLTGGALFVGGLASGPSWACLVMDEKPIAALGLVTDIHHADKEHAGSRYYRQSLVKLDVALAEFKRRKVDRIVHLGDLVDSHPTARAEEDAAHLVADRFRATGIPFHFVLGNHCLFNMDKRRYAAVTGTAGGHESFDLPGMRFLCLDACYRADGVAYGNNNFDYRDILIPDSQLEWMRHQIEGAPSPCVVLVHQLLEDMPGSCAKNHEQVRRLIAGSGKVAAVLQGHHHRNRLVEYDEIPYAVLRSIVDGGDVTSSGHSILSIFRDGSLRLEGFAEQGSYDWRRSRAKKSPKLG